MNLTEDGVVCSWLVNRKKKSKSKSKDKDEEAEAQRLKELEAVMREEERKTSSPAGSSRASPAVVSSDRKTAAEKRFEETQRRRVRRWLAMLCSLSLIATLLVGRESGETCQQDP